MGKRGPPPKSMIKLYHLLRKIPFLPDEEIAEELGIKVKCVGVYKWRLRKKLVMGITSFFDYCPECFRKSVVLKRDTGEYVCANCGFVVEEDGANISKTIPFGTEEEPNTFALTSNIAYGKSLGLTMPKSHLFRVVVTSTKKGSKGSSVGGGREIPIRQMQVVTQTIDPPIVKSLLNYGSLLLKKLGFDQGMGNNHVIADRYGRLLRKIGAYMMVSKSSLQPHQAARAALAYILSKVDQKKAKELVKKYPFNSKYMDLVTILMSV